ncbi:potassium channel family protein [Kribbella sp. NPDC050459]|uniref:potassium channel family protein n=1 Tax=Kribbella sp. NPDC050459 TaxID=3155785 RepID=UPI0033D649DB
MKDGAIDYRQLPQPARRRLAVVSLLRSLLVSFVIVAGYFLLPLRLDGRMPVAGLASGLVVVGLVLGWQIRQISRSPHPRVRAIGALATSVPLFLAVFALTYFLMARIQPASFSEHLSRLDAAYYTVTIFATVGFGDIVPVSGPARVATTVQMLGDLALVGLVARVLVGVVNQNLDRRK